MKKVSLLTLLCVISSVSHADDQYEEYLRKLDEQQKAATAGWHWYNDDVKQDEEEEQAPQQPTVPAEPTKPESKETELTAEWLNENIPKLLNSAINNPTPENLKNYWLAVRLSKDMASRFTDKTKEFYVTHPEFSEAKRRPENGYALTSFKNEVSDNKRLVVQQLFQRAGLWFFYASTCPYCAKEAPVLKSLENLYGVNVLAISLDGLPMPDGSFPEFVSDPTGKIYSDLMIQKTPTLYLVSNDGAQKHMVAEGIVTMDELVDAIVIVAHQNKLISEEEYQSTLDVKQQLVVDKDSGPMRIDSERLNSDPAYLSEVLESRLNEFPTYGTQNVTGTAGVANEIQ
jgi:conjugal transfer pilus assembly protein TraF